MIKPKARLLLVEQQRASVCLLLHITQNSRFPPPEIVRLKHDFCFKHNIPIKYLKLFNDNSSYHRPLLSSRLSLLYIYTVYIYSICPTCINGYYYLLRRIFLSLPGSRLMILFFIAMQGQQ